MSFVRDLERKLRTLKVTLLPPGCESTLPLRLNYQLGVSYVIFGGEDTWLFPVGDGDQLWVTVVDQCGGYFMQRGSPVGLLANHYHVMFSCGLIPNPANLGMWLAVLLTDSDRKQNQQYQRHRKSKMSLDTKKLPAGFKPGTCKVLDMTQDGPQDICTHIYHLFYKGTYNSMATILRLLGGCYDQILRSRVSHEPLISSTQSLVSVPDPKLTPEWITSSTTHVIIGSNIRARWGLGAVLSYHLSHVPTPSLVSRYHDH